MTEHTTPNTDAQTIELTAEEAMDELEGYDGEVTVRYDSTNGGRVEKTGEVVRISDGPVSKLHVDTLEERNGEPITFTVYRNGNVHSTTGRSERRLTARTSETTVVVDGDLETDDREPITDGGIDYDDYAIDVDDLEFDTKCSTRDSTNNITYTLARIDGTGLWVHYSTTQTGPREYTNHIKGVGELSLNAGEVDTETIAETIRDEATRRARDDREEWGETDEKLSTLAEAADEVADHLETGWQYGSLELLGDAIYEGIAGIDNGRAWVSHVEEAFYYEAEGALDDAGLETDDHGMVEDVTRQGLVEAVRQKRNSWLKPHLEYEVHLEFDTTPWHLRALELEQNSVLPEKTARVVAMLEAGLTQSEVADELDVNPSTITRQRKRANRMIDEAKWTVENVEKHE